MHCTADGTYQWWWSVWLIEQHLWPSCLGMYQHAACTPRRLSDDCTWTLTHSLWRHKNRSRDGIRTLHWRFGFGSVQWWVLEFGSVRVQSVMQSGSFGLVSCIPKIGFKFRKFGLGSVQFPSLNRTCQMSPNPASMSTTTSSRMWRTKCINFQTPLRPPTPNF